MVGKKMRKALAFTLAGVMVAGAFVTTGGTVFAAEGDVEINDTNFPDEDFRNTISKKEIDVNEDGTLSKEEIANVKSLSLHGPYGATVSEKHPGCAYYGISNLKGIEYFTALEELTIPGILAKSIDLSNNIELKKLQISNRNGIEYTNIGLESLDLSNNTKLTTLDIHRAPNLKNLNLSKNTNLESVSLTGLPVSEYDFSNNTSLKHILIENSGNLTNVNISNNTALEGIGIYGADNLTKLDISNNVNLTGIGVNCKGITGLDVSKNNKLKNLNLTNCNKITSVDVSNLTELESLYLDGTSVSSVDLSKNSKLFWLRVNSTNISELNIYYNPCLQKAYYEKTSYYDEGTFHWYEYVDETITSEKGYRLFCDKGLKIVCESVEEPKKDDKGTDDKGTEDKGSDGKNSISTTTTTTPTTSTETKKYSNEWVDGKWYNADGTQTYKGTLTWKNNSTGWWVEDTDGWYPQSSWQKIDGKWYYFTDTGYMDYSEYRDGYWLGSDGAWVEEYYGGHWCSNSTGWWYEDSSGWYPQSQYVWIDGTEYWFGADGYWK